MQYILMGNSVVRMSNPLGFTRTECYPGADWDQLLSIISKDYLTTYARSIIFLSTGPVELTVKNKSTREVHVKQEYTYHAIEERIKALKRFGIYVILCTAMPMDFEAYNWHTNVQNPEYSECYDEMTQHLVESVVKLNHEILLLNQRNDFPTPYVHSHVLKRMAGKWKFRSWYLQDGLHPAPETIEIQDRELTNKLIDAIRTLVNQL